MASAAGKEAPEDGMYRFAVTNTANTVNDKMAGASAFSIGFRCDNWASAAFRVRNIIIEKGAEATKRSPEL